MGDFFVVAAGDSFEPTRLLDRLNNPLPLKDLTLCNVNLDDITLSKLCNYLEKTSSLNTVDFSGTRLSRSGLRKLLTSLAKNKSLSAIYLDFCAISNTDLDLIIDLIKAHPALSILSLNNNHITPAKVVEFDAALCSNSLIQEVKGLLISEETKIQLEHNQRLARARNYLLKSQKEDIASTSRLSIIDKTVNKMLATLIQLPKYNESAHCIISDLQWFLATEYTRLGQLKSALASYKLYIQLNQNNLANLNKAELEIANALYAQYLAQPSTPTDQEETFSAQKMLLKGYQHLLRAEQVATTEKMKSEVAQLKSKFQITLGESSIVMGESILDDADKAATAQQFKRRYKKSIS